MKQKYSEYTHWTKTKPHVSFDLSTSSVVGFPLKGLRFSTERLEINRDSTYGYEPLVRAIAGKYGIDPRSVVTTTGASGANHLAMATLIDPGDEVLIESPTFEPLVATANYLGAEVKRFKRIEQDNYALNLYNIQRLMTSRTKLIVITNLHNPSSALIPVPTLIELGELASSVSAHVLVDEVYLDAAYDEPPATSYALGPEFVITSSLTKVYGLIGLRCGWILARPELANAMWRLSDLFAPHPAYPTELLSVAAFDQLDLIRESGRKVVQANRILLREFLREQTEVSACNTEFGTTAWLRLRSERAEQLLERLVSDWDTFAVPGRCFGEFDYHFRIGTGVDTVLFREGIRRLDLALSGKTALARSQSQNFSKQGRATE